MNEKYEDIKTLIKDSNSIKLNIENVINKNYILSNHDLVAIVGELSCILNKVTEILAELDTRLVKSCDTKSYDKFLSAEDIDPENDAKLAKEYEDTQPNLAEVKATDVYNATVSILDELGMPAHLSGYVYMISAVKRLFYKAPNANHQLTTTLYPAIAKEFNSTPTRVERAIRHIIEVTFSNMDEETLKKYFGASVPKSKGRPTNAHFIYTITKIIRRELCGF